MESLWQKTCSLQKREALSGPIKTEAAIIGGGLAGVLTARLLEQKGIHAVILEADRLGSGQTGNTSAKITLQHGPVYHRLIHDYGEDFAGNYAEANLQALRLYQQFIQKYHISCHFAQCPSYLYTTEDNTLILMAEANDASYLGIPSSYTHKTSLPFPVSGAVRFEQQALFHPLEFLSALSEDLTVYERTPVLHVDGNTIMTENGSVSAEHIVFATHYPIFKLTGRFFMRMYQERSYILALKHTPILDGMYLGIDENALSFRNSGSSLLLGGASHRTGFNPSGGNYDFLRSYAGSFYPSAEETAHWSAQDCMTADGIPYIGQFSKRHPNWYAATGFGKWGMTNSMISACILSDLISGKENEFAALYSPFRSLRSSSAGFLTEHGKQAVTSIGKQLFSQPSLTACDLKKGQGAIVKINGKKCAAYRDESGELFSFSSKCPHLGCQLSFNADDKTWECPCHGSRFDYKGNLLDAPSTKNTL